METIYWGNPLKAYLIAAAIIVLGALVIYSLKSIFLSRLKKAAEKTDTPVDDVVIRGFNRTVIPLLIFGVIYYALTTLELPERVSSGLRFLGVVLLTFLITRLITVVVRFMLNAYLVRQERGLEKQKQATGMIILVSIVIWCFALVFLVDNLGYDVTAVLTGLGIGGIAIALAAQTILGDLFSYFVIFFDRPFEVGDFIIVDDKLGTVEYVGIKTTRIKSLSGEQLVFSNTDLTNSRLHNYKRMERRRVVFSLRVVYDTSKPKLEMIPNIIRNIISEQPDVTFDRAHFASYEDFSLRFEVVYYVLSSDYNKYMDVNEVINLRIFEEFRKEGIQFAFPTRSVFLHDQNGKNDRQEVA